jgi:Flp pilus assembly protein TadG
MLRFIKRLKRNQRGVAALEFALSLPLLILLMFGVVEITRFILVGQMVTNVSRTMADLSSQGKTMTEAELTSLFSATKFVAKPFDMQTNGKVIVSSISVTGGGSPDMNWQRSHGDLAGVSSAIGIPGNSLILPPGFTVREGYTVIAAEAYYDFSPIVFSWITPPRRLYRASYFRARLGALTTL